MRGEMGVGSNRMNKYTVGAATQGFANYLNASFPGQKIKVAIAHDSRAERITMTRRQFGIARRQRYLVGVAALELQGAVTAGQAKDHGQCLAHLNAPQ